MEKEDFLPEPDAEVSDIVRTTVRTSLRQPRFNRGQLADRRIKYMNAKQQTINRIIFILSIAGVLMAAYVLQSFVRNTGIVCLTGGGCELVRKNPVSYPFGIPVPAFGLVGYAGLAILSFLRTTSSNRNLLKGMLGIAIFGVCFVSWFTIMELFVIKGVCTWCAVSAVNMYIIFGLIVKSVVLSRK